MRFSIFRRSLIGFISLLYTTACLMTFAYPSCLGAHDGLWAIFAVMVSVIASTTFCAVHTMVGRSSHSVILDIIALFMSVPFAVITTIIVWTSSACDSSSLTAGFLALKTILAIATSLHSIYVLGLSATAALTAITFDRDVFLKDIDATPSPFPMSAVLFSNVLSFITTRKRASLPKEHNESHFCLPGCQCSALTATAPQKAELSDSRVSVAEVTVVTPTPVSTTDRHSQVSKHSSKASVSSVSTLVRLPDPVERRSNIVVGFMTA